MLQDRAIQGVQNPIKFYVRVAERKLSPRFPHPVTKHYCAWIASGNREYLRNMVNRARFMGKNLLVEPHGQSARFLINAPVGRDPGQKVAHSSSRLKPGGLLLPG
jgi:hypothetical protein